jgi:hypothetical protein
MDWECAARRGMHRYRRPFPLGAGKGRRDAVVVGASGCNLRWVAHESHMAHCGSTRHESDHWS